MSKITLITGDSKYSRLFKQKKPEKETVVLLSENTSDKETPDMISDTAKNDVSTVFWNKRSPLSARNSILTIINRFGRLDDAIIIFQAGEFNKTFHEMSSAVYDLQVDRWIKGYGYLLKELTQLFIKQKSGCISLILDTGGHRIMTPVEGAIFNYLKSLVQSLSNLYQNEPFRIFLFETDSGRKEAFIDYYSKTVNEGKYIPGKINRFSDRKSLFDFGKS